MRKARLATACRTWRQGGEGQAGLDHPAKGHGNTRAQGQTDDHAKAGQDRDLPQIDPEDQPRLRAQGFQRGDGRGMGGEIDVGEGYVLGVAQLVDAAGLFQPRRL